MKSLFPYFTRQLFVINVVHFHRKPVPGQVSVERLFAAIRQAMPSDVRCSIHVCPRFSKGFFPRLLNLFAAAKHQAQINHVTGDVHYLAVALRYREQIKNLLLRLLK